jgi:hypothetical protein
MPASEDEAGAAIVDNDGEPTHETTLNSLRRTMAISSRIEAAISSSVTGLVAAS